MPDRLEVLLELPIHWSEAQAEMTAERMLKETATASAVGVHILKSGLVIEDLRMVDDD